jgi:SOS response regulatory protein OraA/RecX
MTDDGHLHTPDGDPGRGLAADPGADPLTGSALSSTAAPEVLDFDQLGELTAPAGSEVVDFGRASVPERSSDGPARRGGGEPLPDRGATSRGPASTDALGAEALVPSEADVASMDDRVAPALATPAVVDPRSLTDRGSPRSPRAAGRRRATVDAVGGDPADDGVRRRRSSFGDDGSRSFGGRRQGGAKKRARREWGIQLDAEVDEPRPASPDGTATGDDDASSTGTRGQRSGRKARAASGGRRRGADGEAPRQYEDPERAAKDICLTALTGTARSRKQLADLLAARDIPDDVAAAVLDRFTEVGLVDDAAFADAWVRSRQSCRGLSRRALAHELRAKGVDAEVASVALEAVDPQDEWDTARALVARKVPGMRRLDTATATRRLTAMLGRKGYGGGLAAWVVREALEADGKAEDAAAEADDAPPELPDPEPAVRRGLWSGRPLDEPDEAPTAEVGEGLTAEGWARTRRPGRGTRQPGS